MEALKITQLRQDLWALDEVGRTVMYVVNGQDAALLIDTGFGLSDLKQVVRTLCGDKKILVVNSHGHPDHNFGNNQFEQVYIGRFDEPSSHEEVGEELAQRLIEGFFGDFLAQGGSVEGWKPGPARELIPLTEGDVLDLGNYRFQVLETPGHSLGSIALFEEKEGWLFTGDSMLTWEVWGQLENSAALSVYGDSMRKLAAIQDRVRTVFPAHWVPDRMPEGRVFPPFELPPDVLTVYAEGIEDTLNGKLEWKDYPFAMGGAEPKMMKCTYFSIGGIAFDPARLGRPAKK